MVGFRRNKPANPDAEFFLTAVTYNRVSWFNTDRDLDFVYDAMWSFRNRFNIKFLAWVILPDHLHWLLAPGDADYSKVIASFKRRVSYYYRKGGFLRDGSKLWQYRFWEHTIRDNEDRERCIEYIHYNPVKHGLVDSPRDWFYSSFHRYLERGIYQADWSEGEDLVVSGAEYD